MTSTGESQSTTNRRGGYGDGGGLTVDNKLPLAEAIYLQSESALKREMEVIGRNLGSTIDWVERIHAIVRLEGIVQGGAVQWPTFCDLLSNLKDPLVAQICDRRSAVSRQACHLISILVSHLGNRFDHLALFFIPVVIKVLTITVQVMAEAADECLQTMLHYCRSGKILPKIADFMVSDKSSKIRKYCAKYLLQAFDSWNSKQYERYVDFLFPGLQASLQDASSETREAGRSAVSALYHAFPEKGKSFVHSLDGSLQQKIKAAIRNHKKTEEFKPKTIIYETPNRIPVINTSINELRVIQSVPRNITSDKHEEDISSPESSLKGLQIHSNHQKMHLSRSVAPSRVKESDMDAKNFTFPTPPPVDTSEVGQNMFPHAERISHLSISTDSKVQRKQTKMERIHPYSRATTPEHGSKRCDTVGPQRLLVSESPVPSDCSEALANIGSAELTNVESNSLSLDFLLKQATTLGIDWRTKEETLAKLLELFEEHTVAASDLFQSLQTLCQMLCSYLQDPHHKVVSSTLRLIISFVTKHQTFMESIYPKIAHLLYAKLIDARAHIRSDTSTILQHCAKCCSINVLLETCMNCLSSMSIPKVLPHIFESSCFFIDEKKDSLLQGAAVRQWICQLCSFTNDKNPAIRKAASEALDHFFNSIPQTKIKEHLQVADPLEQIILMRNLRQKYPDYLPDYSSVGRILEKDELMDVDDSQMDVDDSQMDVDDSQMDVEVHTKQEKDKSMEKKTDADNRFLESLYLCRSIKEVEKIDTLTALSEKLCKPTLTPPLSFQSEIIDEIMNLYNSSGSAVQEQALMLLNDFVLACDSSVPLKDACKLFHFLIHIKNEESNLVCLAIDVLLDTILRRIAPSHTFDMCISCFLSMDVAAAIVISQFLRLVKVFTRLSCFLDHKLVKKKMEETNFQVVQRLVKQWSSDRVDVRKAVVCCLAQIGNKIPERIEAFMTDVHESERKLLHLYMEKMAEEQSPSTHM